MKLHTLGIAAFGPFAGKEEINFSDLGENPLFLIDGQTGAGKSSILHAICYALYGETTDADRKDLGLRCDHAESDLLTELSLEFSIRGQHYRITREPTQMRPAKRGDGETEHVATAHLRKVLDDGTEETLVPKKKTEADTKIKEIIGLSADQFRQVMVLPQGRFRELLLAKSDDRQEILSTLFQTEIYKRIEQILKDKSGDIERQYKAIELSKKDTFVDAHVADWNALIEGVEKALEVLQQRKVAKEKADELRQAEAATVKSAQVLLDSFDAQTTKQDELGKHQSQSDYVDAQRLKITRAEKSAKIAPKWQALQTVVADIAVKDTDITNANEAKTLAKQQVEDATVRLGEAQKMHNQRDQLKAKETLLKSYRDTLAGYDKIKAASSRAVSAHNGADTRKAQLVALLGDLDTEILGHVDAEKRLGNLVSQKAEFVKQEFDAKYRFDNRTKLEIAYTELSRLNDASVVAKKRFDDATAATKEAEKDADRLEKFWFTSQAAVLAEKLQEGEPCQVCGSLEHPNPAMFEHDAEQINQDMVDAARKAQSDYLTLRTDADKKLADSKSAVANKQSDIKELEAQLGEYAGSTVAELEQAYTKLVDLLIEISANEKMLATTTNTKQLKEEKRKPLQAELKELDDQLLVLISAKAKAGSELEAAEKGLPEAYRSGQVLEQAITDTSHSIVEIETYYKVAQAAQQHALTTHAAAESTVTSLNTDLEKLQIRLGEKKSQWETALVDSDFVTQSDFSDAHLEVSSLEQHREHVRDYDDTLRDIKATLVLMGKQLKGKKNPDMALLQTNQQVADSAFKIAEDAWTTANNHCEMLARTQLKIENLDKKQSTVKRQFEVVGKMAKAALGKGNVRVSLERFVLGNLLDSVLSIASQRLHLMSKGQYRLVRQDESNQKRNTTAGLDLAIDDAYSGKSRPVATLSGGESFMASLALALALSDVVQQRSGGIQLDTLFVDEGFGSLDQESLQLAINTLVELQSSGRTIGIISHVSELKEQMPQRIDVVRTRTGSTVKLVAA